MNDETDKVNAPVGGAPVEEDVSQETSPERFWKATAGVEALSDPRPYGQENALQKLGRPPFEKSARSNFRLLGYLATVYEHVSKDVGTDLDNRPRNDP